MPRLSLSALLASCCLATLALALPAGARAQSDAAAETPPEVSAKDASAAAQAELEARVQTMRKQLAATTDGNERFRLLTDLANAYYRAGRIPDSLKVGDEIVDDGSIGAGRRSVRASLLALSWALQGDYSKGKRSIDRAKSLAAETRPAELDELPREPGYAFLHAEAEIARRAENRPDVALQKTREASEVAWQNFNDAALSEKRHRAAANELLNNVNLHVRLLVQNNRRAEAMSYVTEIQQRIATRPDLKATTYQVASIGEAEAIALSSQDDYDGALAAIDKSVALFTSLHLPEFDSGYNYALRMRMMVALAMGRIADYAKDGDVLLRARSANPVLAGSYAAEEADSLALASRGQWSDASARIALVIARNKRRSGDENPFVKYQSAMQMLYMLHDPVRPATPSDIEQFVSRLANDDGDWADASYRGSYVEDGALSASLGVLLPAGQRPSADALALAFRISELLRSSISQGALADGASRLAAGDPKLRGLIEQEQQLRFDRNTSRQSFARSAERLDRMSQAIVDDRVSARQASEVADRARSPEASDARLKQLRRDISAQFPVYRELVSPRIPSAARIGAALRPGEVYLNLYAAVDNGYAFIVQPGGRLSGTRLAITRAEARRLITALRAPFDAGVPPAREGDPAGFDLSASHALFAAWLAPLKDDLQGAHTVYISAGGPLSNLPWNVLVTAPARSIAEASWWAGQVAQVQMPSASSLVLARSQPPHPARRPFLAFADPSFDGSDSAPVADGATRGSRQPPVARSAVLKDFDYRQVVRLPETLDEARAIGVALNAGDGSVIRGAAATRSRVMKEDLSDVRVLEFATHGLLPGELPGLMRSGLAMGFEGRGADDSVLTIDDIIGLRLDADWVILSACNTGYASGAAGDSMSSLERGFFAAGARTVLATQWAVESQSAKELAVGVFKTLAADPALSKADALARTQRDMIAGKSGALYKHPYFWAPYFISGDAR